MVLTCCRLGSGLGDDVLEAMKLSEYQEVRSELAHANRRRHASAAEHIAPALSAAKQRHVPLYSVEGDKSCGE